MTYSKSLLASALVLVVLTAPLASASAAKPQPPRRARYGRFWPAGGEGTVRS